MKKACSLVLAIAMVMSLAAATFAADNHKNDQFAIDSASLYYSADYNSMTASVIPYGKAAYFGIYFDKKDDGNYTLLRDYKDVEKLKVKAKWEMGSDLVESVSVVKKLLNPARSKGLSFPPDSEGYYYFLEVKTKFKSTTSEADIIGTLTFNKKGSNDSDWKLDDLDEDISINVSYEKSYLNTENLTIKNDVAELKWDIYYLLKFDYDDEVELSFGSSNGGDNEGTFTLDVSGQGKVLLYYLTNADEAIAAANPGAKMNFLKFNNAKFNRTGEFMYEMEDGAYAYQIVDGQLKTIPGCKYDESDEAFYFNTRTLGYYVFSNVELVNPTVEAPVVEASAEGVNPDTGAAA